MVKSNYIGELPACRDNAEGSWARSREMPPTKQGNLIRKTHLTPQEVEVVQGCLLGDGTLSPAGKNYRLRVEHKSAHWEYVEWKFSLLRRICLNESQYVPTHSSLRFGSVGHPDLLQMRKQWYHSRKQIPQDLVLTPLMLAIWFMDDGTRHRDTIDISVHNFSDENLQSLRSQLLRMSIVTTINNDAKGNRLYVVKHSYPEFKKLVAPYIVGCMAYKLP